MKKIERNTLSLLLFILLITLSALSLHNYFSSNQRTDFHLYEGRPLQIGVIGEFPEVKEDQVRFTKITFDDLKSESLSYDSIFIMKDNFDKASDSQYADIYLESEIPFFFIQSTKGVVPFIEQDLSYSDVPEVSSLEYASGMLGSGDEEEYITWGYGLYNDNETVDHIMEMYSRIFNTIAKNEYSTF